MSQIATHENETKEAKSQDETKDVELNVASVQIVFQLTTTTTNGSTEHRLGITDCDSTNYAFATGDALRLLSNYDEPTKYISTDKHMIVEPVRIYLLQYSELSPYILVMFFYLFFFCFAC